MTMMVMTTISSMSVKAALPGRCGRAFMVRIFKTKDQMGKTRAGRPGYAAYWLPMVEIILMSGRKRANTTEPTINARITIMIGSRIEVSAVTALSTSSS